MTEEFVSRGDKLARIKEITEQVAALEEEKDELREEAVEPMEGPELIVDSEGKKWRVSKVVGSTPVFHHGRISGLGESKRELITETKIVGAKLKDAVERGLIAPEVAAGLVSYNPKRPYAKFDPMP